MPLTRWIKPNGTELDLNDEKATVEMAESMNWKRLDESEAGLAQAEATIAKAEAKVKAKAKADAKVK